MSDDPFNRLTVLETWLLQHQNVEVVVSSTWRESRSIDQLRALFSPKFRQRIIGVTSRIAGDSPDRFPQEVEVAMWLRESGQPWRPWAAHDDQAWLFRPFNHRAVLCDPEVGLGDISVT